MSSASDGRDGSCLQRRLYVELSISLKPTLCEALPALCVSKSKIRRSDLLGSSAARSRHCSTISRCLMSTVICMYASSVDSVKCKMNPDLSVLPVDVQTSHTMLEMSCFPYCFLNVVVMPWSSGWIKEVVFLGRYATVISPSLSFHCVSWWMLWTVI